MNTKNGYIALTSVLVIAAVILIIVVATSLLAISEAQISLSDTRGSKTTDFVESCTEDALILLNENNALPSSISHPEGTCTISNVSTASTVWTFTVSATVETHTKAIEVVANRDGGISITSWTEL